MNANGERLFKWDLNELPPDDGNDAMSSQQVSEGTSPTIIIIDSDDENEPVGGQRGNYVPVVAPVGGAPTIGFNLVETSSSNHRNQRRRVGYSNSAIYSGYNLPSPTPPSPQSPSLPPFSPPPPPLSPSPLPSLSPPPPPSTPAPAPAPAPALALAPLPASTLAPSPSLSPSPSSPPTPSAPPPFPPQEPPTINCAICWEAVAKSVTTRCGHIFCESCIAKSIDKGGPKCPTCREKVNKDDLVQVYFQGPPPSRPVCPICMGQLNEEMVHQCGHVYCEACISAALAIKNKCPICKKKATYRDLIRIYLDV